MHIPNQESRGHISPTKIYFIVGIALYVLTVVTVAAALFDTGSALLNFIIAMGIATLKAFLVLWYFMHMKYENKLIWIFGILYPVVLFALLVAMTVIDVFNRVPVTPSF